MRFDIVPYFDLGAVFFSILAIYHLYHIKDIRRFPSTFILFLFTFSIYGVIQLFNALEHAEILTMFDPIEDYAEILIVPLLIFSFYSYFLNVQLKKREETESELKLALEKARESNRLKSAFLANMSHEIRTPMNAILGFTELLKKDNLTSEKRNIFNEIIENNSKLLMSLINDIIDISKIESGQLEIVREEFELNEMLIEVYKTFQDQVERKGLEFNLKIDEELENQVIYSDAFRIKQIFTNLVSNAIKFTEDGFIEMGAILKYPFIEFYVQDTGDGISKEEQKMVFERFMQSKKQDTRKVQKGTGLGLAISKALAMRLGGKIDIESQLGKGARFSFTIPHRKLKQLRPEAEIVESFASNGDWSNYTFLIAEDEDFNFVYFEELLRNTKVKIIRAITGVETIEKLKTHSKVDLVLMDIKMPELDGLKATTKIRQFNKDVPIIAQTAYAMVGDREKAIQAGCNDYIAKPFKADELFELIQNYLG